MKGTILENDKYINKQNNAVCFGVAPVQGQRNDLRRIVNMNVIDIIEEYPEIYVKYHKGI